MRKVSPAGRRVVRVLARDGVITRSEAFVATRARNYNTLKVQLYRVRQWLRSRDITLHNRYGMGWYISEEDEARLRDEVFGE